MSREVRVEQADRRGFNGSKPEKTGQCSSGLARVSARSGTRETSRTSRKFPLRESRLSRTSCLSREWMMRAGAERTYLALMSTGFDCALPPPATMMMNDIPAFASGTMASIVESPMNLKVTGMLEAALNVTV